MLTLASYQGVVRDGVIRLRSGRLPEGTKVLVVAVESKLLPLDEQIRRLEAVAPGERRQAFEDFVAFADQHPAEVDIDTISDEELDALVHEVRAERLGLK